MPTCIGLFQNVKTPFIYYSTLFPLAGFSWWGIIGWIVGGISLIVLCIAFAKCIWKRHATAQNFRAVELSNSDTYQEPPGMVYSVSGPNGTPVASMDPFNTEGMLPPTYDALMAPTWNGDNASVTTQGGGAMAARGITGADNPVYGKDLPGSKQ